MFKYKIKDHSLSGFLFCVKENNYMKQYTAKDFEEMKQLKKDYEEVDMELTVGVIQRRLRVGLETAKAIYNDLNAIEEKNG